MLGITEPDEPSKGGKRAVPSSHGPSKGVGRLHSETTANEAESKKRKRRKKSEYVTDKSREMVDRRQPSEDIWFAEVSLILTDVSREIAEFDKVSNRKE